MELLLLELQAALKDASKARILAANPWNETAYGEAWADHQAITRVIALMQKRNYDKTRRN